MQDSATRDAQAALAQGGEHVLGQRPLVLGVDGLAELLAQARRRAPSSAAADSGSARTVTSTSSGRAQIVVRVPPASPPAAAKARATAGSPTP